MLTLNTLPFRVYVISYDCLKHKFVYKVRDFKPDQEIYAGGYARDHEE